MNCYFIKYTSILYTYYIYTIYSTISNVLYYKVPCTNTRLYKCLHLSYIYEL